LNEDYPDPDRLYVVFSSFFCSAGNLWPFFVVSDHHHFLTFAHSIVSSRPGNGGNLANIDGFRANFEEEKAVKSEGRRASKNIYYNITK
jgi:hypothetical protein